MTRAHVVAALLGIGVGALQLNAQQTAKCDPAKSFDACYAAMLSSATDTIKKATVTGTAAAVSAKPTGSAGSSAAGASTAIKDFLPQFASAFSLPGFAGPGKGLDLEANRNIGASTIQLQAVSQDPQIFDALVARIPQKTRSAAKDSITKTLGDLDNVSLTLSGNVEKGPFGRLYKRYAPWISDLTNAVVTATLQDPDAVSRADMALQQVTNLPHTASDTCNSAPTRRPLSCYAATDQVTIENAVAAVAAAQLAASGAAHDALVKNGLDKLADLLNNNDQLTFKGSYSALQRVIGPNLVTATARAEASPANLTDAVNACPVGSAPSCYSSYVKSHLSSLERGDRFWLQLDATQSRAYSFALAADSARVILPKSLTLEPTVGYGTYVDQSGQRVRVDVGIAYRFSDKQAVRQNRWSSTLTLTQQLSDQSSAGLTFVWVDHTDFVGSVDKRLRANVGLSYKVSKPGT